MTPSKRILYLSNTIIPSELSRSLSIMRVCQAFCDAGHNVTLTAIKSNTNYSEPIQFYGLKGGFNVLTYTLNSLMKSRNMRKLGLSGLIIARKTRNTVKSLKPDIIYSRLTLAELFCVPNQTPIIYEMHSLGFLGGTWWQKRFFTWILKHKKIQRIIVTTHLLKDILIEHIQHLNIDVVVAPLSAERPITLTTQDINAFKKAKIRGTGKWHVGYTGYLDKDGLRGTDIICKAAAKLPNVEFHIVGGDPVIVERWKHYATTCNIHFYGYQNPNLMPYYLSCFDVALAPLQLETSKRAPLGKNMSPLKLPQYFAYGCAIIASDLPTHREILTHDENALLVPHSDVDAWVAAITRLSKDKELYKKLQTNARKRYFEEFTPEQRVKKILQ